MTGIAALGSSPLGSVSIAGRAAPILSFGDPLALLIADSQGALPADLPSPLDALLSETDDLTLWALVLASLFTDRRASTQDIPENMDPRGSWQDSYSKRKKGSLLWLAALRSCTDASAKTAAQHANDALAWMVEDGLAGSVNAIVRKAGNGIMSLVGSITRPNKPDLHFILNDLWSVIHA